MSTGDIKLYSCRFFNTFLGELTGTQFSVDEILRRATVAVFLLRNGEVSQSELSSPSSVPKTRNLENHAIEVF